ncbi:uncharacterized protein LOC62_02G002243 [Vanrija pseudolonga]|uniref:Uncharacterized protein n=1 Tax=Vanrija pseudolonga TaxID=143232 RepID=A0AAF1BP05_9TREE|nr:hypothetical protein LOC62_02G002243 [Vanrija pseudolonga]
MSFNCSYLYNPNVTCLQPNNVSANGVAYVLLYDADMAKAGKCLLSQDLVFTECVTQSKERRAALGLPSGSRAVPTLGPLPLLLLVLAFLSATCAKAVPCSSFTPDPRDTWNWNATTEGTVLSGADDCSVAACGGNITNTTTIKLEWEVNTTAVEVKAAAADIVATVTSVPTDGMWILNGRAYLIAYAHAVQVQGWFEGCSDRQRYRGSALVPDGDRVVLRYVYTDRTRRR